MAEGIIYSQNINAHKADLNNISEPKRLNIQDLIQHLTGTTDKQQQQEEIKLLLVVLQDPTQNPIDPKYDLIIQDQLVELATQLQKDIMKLLKNLF